MSKIEDKFANIFLSAGIRFIREKTFSDLRNGYLRYDFYLPDLNVLVEVDSMLHFKRIPKFHTTQHDFVHAQENDRLKNSYALSHKINLYRVPEWCFQEVNNIQDIFNSKFLVKSKWHNDQIYRQYLKDNE